LRQNVSKGKHPDPIHTNAFLFENAFFFCAFLSTVYTKKLKTEIGIAKTDVFLKTLSIVETFENEAFSYYCGRPKQSFTKRHS